MTSASYVELWFPAEIGGSCRAFIVGRFMSRVALAPKERVKEEQKITQITQMTHESATETKCADMKTQKSKQSTADNSIYRPSLCLEKCTSFETT